MAIRLNDLDLESEGMKRTQSAFLGTRTTDGDTDIIFVAPVACTLDHIDVYTKQTVPNAAATASAEVVTLTVRLATNSDSTLQVRGTSGNAALTTDTLSANSRYRLTPSANNSLSTGTPVELNLSAQGNGALTGCLVVCRYTPLKHRETR